MPALAGLGALISAGAGVAGAVASGEASKKHYDFKDFSAGYQPDAWKYQEGGSGGMASPYEQQFGQQYGNANASRGDQAGLLARLQAAEAGKVPSVAQEQLKAGGQMAIEQAANVAAGAQGEAGLGLAQGVRQKAQQRAIADTNMQNALLRANETATARGQQVGLTGQMRGQDLQQQQAVGQMAQFYRRMGFSEGEANMHAQQDFDKWRVGNEMQVQGMQAGQYMGNKDIEGKEWGGSMKAVGDTISKLMAMGGGAGAGAPPAGGAPPPAAGA